MASSYAAPPQQVQAHTADAIMAVTIDDYLRKKGSPIAGSDVAIVSVGREFDLDPRLLVALAGAETGFGTAITTGANNVCNVLWRGHKSPVPNYRRPFHAAGRFPK